MSRNDVQLTVRSKGRSTPGTFKSSDFKTYQTAMEHEKPRVLRGESSKFRSTEYLDKIEKAESESVNELRQDV